MRTVRLILGKFPVVEVRKGAIGYSAKLKVDDHGTIFTINAPYDFIDIRQGDFLTFHCDVAIKDSPDAIPQPTPKQ